MRPSIKFATAAGRRNDTLEGVGGQREGHEAGASVAAA